MKNIETLISKRVGYTWPIGAFSTHAVTPRPEMARLRHERAAHCTPSAATGVDFVTTNFVVDTTVDRCPWSTAST